MRSCVDTRTIHRFVDETHVQPRMLFDVAPLVPAMASCFELLKFPHNHLLQLARIGGFDNPFLDVCPDQSAHHEVPPKEGGAPHAHLFHEDSPGFLRDHHLLRARLSGPDSLPLGGPCALALSPGSRGNSTIFRSPLSLTLRERHGQLRWQWREERRRSERERNVRRRDESKEPASKLLRSRGSVFPSLWCERSQRKEK